MIRVTARHTTVKERILERANEIRGVTPEQLEFIVKYYGIVPINVIASVTGINRYKISRIARKLGLKPVRGRYARYVAICFNSETIIYER